MARAESCSLAEWWKGDGREVVDEIGIPPPGLRAGGVQLRLGFHGRSGAGGSN
jgi:hypothetical protein